MRIDGRDYRTIWTSGPGGDVVVIDQRLLPHAFETVQLASAAEAAEAISNMTVRGAPLIGAAGAYGLALAMRSDPSDPSLEQASEQLGSARPTAVNLRWAVERMRRRLEPLAPADRVEAAYDEATRIADEDVAVCEAIGGHGLELVRAARRPGKEQVDILTHCNAGWLCAVDWGTALAPIYKASRAGIPVHVWVDETRPRNQGASLTAWELGKEGVPHTVIADNAGGHLMQHGMVDLCIVGSDRTTRAGDVCNKIGTYLKALAAHDNGVPFYVALPSSTIDWRIDDGLAGIPIEQRSAEEVTHICGLGDDGRLHRVRLTPEGSAAANHGFDVTPARLVSGLITERGLCAASGPALAEMFGKRERAA
jgi:methylthioribose-1-phosphate isomerase